MQHEITEPSDLLDKSGKLIQEGWAKKLILHYNRNNIHQGWLRIKEWDYYAVLTPKFGIAMTASDLGIMALYNVVWLDFEKKEFYSDEEMKLLSKGKSIGSYFPKSSETGDIVFNGKNIKLSFIKKPGKRLLKVDFPSWNNGEGIKADLEVDQPEQDTMVIATSWKENRKCFYYNQKINCMPTKGKVTVGSQEYEFKPEEAMAVLDWGRGVWTYKNTWYWGSLSGLHNGVPIGWNIGYGFSDRSPASENLIFYDGKAHKIEEVTFHIDPEDYLKPWKFTSSDGRFEMDFEPLIDRNSKTNLLIFSSLQHQVFGLFTGDLILDDGRKIHIDKMLGFAEEVANKW